METASGRITQRELECTVTHSLLPRSLRIAGGLIRAPFYTGPQALFVWEKVVPGTRVTLLPEAGCDLSCKRSLRFIKKRMTSWRTQGDSGRRVTRVPGTTFSHINRASVSHLPPARNDAREQRSPHRVRPPATRRLLTLLLLLSSSQNVTQTRAKTHSISSARLPLDEYLERRKGGEGGGNFTFSKVLTVNQGLFSRGTVAHGHPYDKHCFV